MAATALQRRQRATFAGHDLRIQYTDIAGADHCVPASFENLLWLDVDLGVYRLKGKDRVGKGRSDKFILSQHCSVLSGELNKRIEI